MAMAVFIFLLLSFVLIFVGHYWSTFMASKRRFNYRITDIWAAMAGLSPSMICIALLSKHIETHGSGDERTHFYTGGLIIIAVFQVAGLIVGRIDIEPRERELGPITAWSSALSIFTGAFVGILMGLMAGLVAGRLCALI